METGKTNWQRQRKTRLFSLGEEEKKRQEQEVWGAETRQECKFQNKTR